MLLLLRMGYGIVVVLEVDDMHSCVAIHVLILTTVPRTSQGLALAAKAISEFSISRRRLAEKATHLVRWACCKLH